MYKTKLGPEAEVSKFKTRIVARGFWQIYGGDYEETFPPVARLSSRSILAWAAQQGKKIHQKKVVTTFSIRMQKEDIFVVPPRGYTNRHKYGVLRLKKGLYGSKESGRLWYYELYAALSKMEFTRLDADHSIYSKLGNGEGIVIIVYVDDLVIITDKDTTMDTNKRRIEARWKTAVISHMF